MKFPRTARIFRGQLDAAPFVTVFFLLVIFVLLGSLIYTPGVHLQLPVADNLPGLEMQPIAVAIDRNGRFYYDNEGVEEAQLPGHLKAAVQKATKPPALLIEADEAVPYRMLIRLTLIAREAGISNAFLATLPRTIGPAQRMVP